MNEINAATANKKNKNITTDIDKINIRISIIYISLKASIASSKLLTIQEYPPA